MKRLLVVLAGLLVVVLLLAAVGYGYASVQADRFMSREFTEVQGKDLPVPWPLTKAEIDTLRADRLAAMAADAPENAVGEQDAAVDVAKGASPPTSVRRTGTGRSATGFSARTPEAPCHRSTTSGSRTARSRTWWRSRSPFLRWTG